MSGCPVGLYIQGRSVAAGGRAQVRFLVLVLVGGHLREAQDCGAALQAVVVGLFLAVDALGLVAATYDK